MRRGCSRAYHRGVLRPEYPIRTERLVLRPYVESDFAGLYAMQSDPAVVRYLYWEVHDEAASRQALTRRLTQTALADEGESLCLAVELPGNGVIGDVLLRWLSRVHQQGEIGFVFNPKFHGKGYAREAAEAVLRLGFEALGLHRIKGCCDSLNTPSARLMERMGMRREAHFVEDEMFKGQWGDQYVYAMLDREWKAR